MQSWTTLSLRPLAVTHSAQRVAVGDFLAAREAQATIVVGIDSVSRKRDGVVDVGVVVHLNAAAADYGLVDVEKFNLASGSGGEAGVRSQKTDGHGKLHF